MGLKFWKRGQADQAGQKNKLPRPKELPQAVGMHMVTKLNQDPDWVWSLKALLRPNSENPQVQDIRIYNPQDAFERDVHVENFTSLDSHPDLILYAGTFNKVTGTVQIEKPAQAA